MRRGENRSTRVKTSQSREENQQTQPTYDTESGNWTRATLVGGECSHHYAKTAPQYNTRLASKSANYISAIKTNYGKFNISFAAVKVWNHLDESVKHHPHKTLKTKSYCSWVFKWFLLFPIFFFFFFNSCLPLSFFFFFSD